MGAVLVDETRDLHDVVVVERADRATVRDVDDQRRLPALHRGGHHRGGDALVALPLEHVVELGLLLDRLAALAREVGRVAFAHRALPRRLRAGQVAGVDPRAEHGPQGVVQHLELPAARAPGAADVRHRFVPVVIEVEVLHREHPDRPHELGIEQRPLLVGALQLLEPVEHLGQAVLAVDQHAVDPSAVVQPGVVGVELLARHPQERGHAALHRDRSVADPDRRARSCGRAAPASRSPPGS